MFFLFWEMKALFPLLSHQTVHTDLETSMIYLKILQNHLNFCFLKLLYYMVFSNVTYIKGQFTLYLHLQITINAPISLCEYKLHIGSKC